MTTAPIAMTVTPKRSGLLPPSEIEPKIDSTVVVAREQLARAELILYKPTTAVSGQDIGAVKDRITFQFNPKELTVAKSASWTPHPARGATKAAPSEFNGAGQSKLTLEMFFDATDHHDRSVVEPIEKLFSCCVPTEETAELRKPLPPLVVFSWGKLRGFPSYVTQVNARYTLFSPDGIPIRATASVTMDEMPGVTARQNPTSGALHSRREHTVRAGDTLASVAFAMYGDPTRWRTLAEFNGIDDPQRVAAGTPLLIPSIEELAGEGT